MASPSVRGIAHVKPIPGPRFVGVGSKLTSHPPTSQTPSTDSDTTLLKPPESRVYPGGADSSRARERLDGVRKAVSSGHEVWKAPGGRSGRAIGFRNL